MIRPSTKDRAISAYIEYLEDKLSKFEKSPFAKTYLTIYNQIESFNEQLTIKKEKKTLEGQEYIVEVGKVDLFGDNTDKSFDRTKWFFENILDINKSLSELRKMMSPEERDAADRNMPLAEKLLKNG